MSKIKVIIKEPFKDPRIEEIEYNNATMQDIVKGSLYFLPFPTLTEVDMVVNDDAEMENQDHNVRMPHENDIAYGTIVACSFGTNNKAQTLSDEQINKIMKYLKENSIELKQQAEAT